ncbi:MULTISPECIES: complement resistance protein TraT [Vibrio]|uniref:Complement resistance protein TraT n=1 Tax=Vibrio ostreae TaxID=2841925 RepID=A0A975U6I2_9VIBR|nr:MULTISPECIES: complement resistance protein TraT [Vibrio]QXO15830.1 complement resistance protein TraT [Vibrio ostreae]
MNTNAKFGFLLAAILSVSGCSAINTAVSKRNLEVKTTMSETIWLDPVSASQRTIFLQVRNTTDKQIDIQQELKEKLTQKGYSVVQDPAAAHYWLQANVLKAEKMDPASAQGFLNSGYGGALSGAAIGALAAASATSHSNTIGAAGLIGGAIGLVGNALVEDVYYALITDVRVVEKTDNKVTSTEVAQLSNGNSGALNTSISSVDNKKRFQTRVLSNANQVNLEFEEAKPVLVEDLTTSISGIF